jgi:hypothetical protein
MHHARRRLSIAFRGMVVSCPGNVSRINSKSSLVRLAQDRCNSTFEIHCECEGVYSWVDPRTRHLKRIIGIDQARY